MLSGSVRRLPTSSESLYKLGWREGILEAAAKNHLSIISLLYLTHYISTGPLLALYYLLPFFPDTIPRGHLKVHNLSS